MSFYSELYSKHISQAQAICHQRQFLSNFVFMLNNDLNLVDYKKNILDNIGFMIGLKLKEPKKYYTFKSQTKEVNTALNSLFLASKEVFKNKTQDEIMEPCSLLNDSHGIGFMKLIGLLALTRSILMHCKLKEMKSKKDLNIDEFEERFSHLNIIAQRKKYLDLSEKDFLNLDSYKKHLDLNSKNIEEDMLDLSHNLEILLNSNKLIDDLLIKIGKELWTEDLNRHQDMVNKFKEICENIIK